MSGPAISGAAEASVRQLIANGDKAALEQAKEIHKVHGTAVSEALLVDAYAERVRSLLRRNLTLEAKSLLDLVRARYPSARTRLDELMTRVVARPRSLDDLVRPLNDPALGASQRAAIEGALQQEVCDLAALAGCEALPVDHPLRKAASALERAFVTATSGPVDEETLALPDVSHRSPLAPWKLLVRAIASFYEGDDESCQRCLRGINPESAPARLVPAIQAMLRADTAAPLTPAAAALEARVTSNSTALGNALESLDQAFISGNRARILKAIRPVVDACQHSSPGRLESLRQHISVRSAVADLDPAKVAAAMRGPSRHDATFLRLFASGMEETRDPEKVVVACGLWEEFRQMAVQEGWFAANGAETAALSLHMADLLQQLPEELLRELQYSAHSQVKAGGAKRSFLFPEELYQRACVLDPHPEAFSQWMEWAARQSGSQAERVAAAWHKIRPLDIEPLLRLMNEAEARRAFGSALGYLAKVEQIDGLNPGVRGTRFRLLAGSALRHLQQKKPVLAAEDVAEMAALPQSHQGDRPAFLAALRFVVSAVRGNVEDAAACRVDIERLLESSAAAAILLFGVATAAKQAALARLGSVEKLSSVERSSLPRAAAKVTALAAEMRMKLEIPRLWMIEAADQFPASRHNLDTDQLRTLAEASLLAGHAELAYAVSAAGLGRGGATDARFLLLRARSVTELTRRVVCARAAAELARQQQDTELVGEAVELVRGLFESGQVSLTLDQARDVLQREKAQPEPPTRKRPGPDYRHLVPACPCPDCRRARGEVVGPFDDLDEDEFGDDEDFGFELPPDMPPEIAEMFAQEAREAMRRGESFEEFVARVLAGGPPRRRRKKGRRP